LISLTFKLLPHWIIDNVRLFILHWHAITCMIVNSLFPNETTLLPQLSMILFLDGFGYPFYCFLFPSRVTCVIPLWTSLFSPVIKVCLLWSHFPQDSESCIHICIISILGILGPKLCILYLSPFIPSRQRFHLHLSGWRNLNRGICHTPIFNLRSRLIYNFSYFLSEIFYALSDEISAEVF
jgi:hypothetical protein